MSAFSAWFYAHMPSIRFFKPEELLTKGASNASLKLNTDPPEHLWPNVVPLVHVLEEFRERVGYPVRLHSVYRSPAYNAAIGGAKNSQHKQFTAADFSVAGRGKPADWAATLRAMRDDGAFTGGIGEYKTFVHVDVRGTNADWLGSGVSGGGGMVLGQSRSQAPYDAGANAERDPSVELEVAKSQPQPSRQSDTVAGVTLGTGILAAARETANDTLWWIGLAVVVGAVGYGIFKSKFWKRKGAD